MEAVPGPSLREFDAPVIYVVDAPLLWVQNLPRTLKKQLTMMPLSSPQPQI
jgi:hypothetical protein